MFTDGSISAIEQVIQMMTENKLKCKNLSIEIQRMWNMKCVDIPVTIGDMGIVTKGMTNTWRQYQECIQDILYNKQLYWEHRA